MTKETILVNETDKEYYNNAYIISMAISNAINPGFKVWATYEGEALEILGEFLEQSYPGLINSPEEIEEEEAENYYGVNGGEYYINVPLHNMWVEASTDENKQNTPVCIYNCDYSFNCCDCGGYECGCRYCWSCNACEICLED